jgi:D-alanyl-D-alanine dipeptidase
MVNRLIIFFFVLFSSTGALAQSPLSDNDKKFLDTKQDSLAHYGRLIVESDDVAVRFRSDSFFTRILMRALKTKHSFYYPFDSLLNISRVYSPDSAFRIFTWQVSKDEDVHRRHGAIQMNTPDGSLVRFPLIDRSKLIVNQTDTITNHDWWIGAIYYRVLLNEWQNKKIYTLIGYDENSIRSTKKRLEVLRFDQQGNPVFGGPFFSFAEDTIPEKTQSRFWIEYKKNGNARMVYDDDLNMIIYDHLISESNEPAKKFTYHPDGDYEGFKWVNGQWVHVDKVFDQKLEDGQAPVAKPLNEKKFLPVKKDNED